MNLLYVASHTVPLLSSSSSSNHGGSVGPTKSDGAGVSSSYVSSSSTTTTAMTSEISNRASLVAIHSTIDGTLCGAVPAHLEAPPAILDDISTTLFGSTGKYPKHNAASTMLHHHHNATSGGGMVGYTNSNTMHAKLPRHAYRPPFQSYTATTSGVGGVSSFASTHPLMNTQPQYHRM
eukprot:11178357-Ditylum_brightwellii.AAC.1